MTLAMKIFLLLGLLLFAQSLWSLVDGYRFLRYVRASYGKSPVPFAPPAAVVIPCKGWDAGFERNVGYYLNQEYPSYQIIFAVASEDDPACKWLAANLRERSLPSADQRVKATLVVAGYSESRGEKVHNLLRGLSAVDPETEILVFADVDAQPSRDWLRWLVAPLRDPQVTVSTGFRWYLPGAGFVSQLRAAWDTSIAMLMGDHDHNFAWGGAMAIRAADFARLCIAERYWASTVSDDYSLTRAVREAGGHIRFVPRCLVASRGESSLGDFLRWANRQIIITRVYAAHLWRMGLGAYLFFCGTTFYGLVELALPRTSVAQRWEIAGLLAAIQLLGLAKARIRTVVARENFPDDVAVLRRYGARYWQLWPLVPWVMLLNFVVAGLTRHIEWRDTHYELRSREEVRVLRRGTS
jgi:ceramide glucosyltransferase